MSNDRPEPLESLEKLLSMTESCVQNILNKMASPNASAETLGNLGNALSGCESTITRLKSDIAVLKNAKPTS